ncbi:MAG: hypothetical protein ACR2NP_22565 [Pirellulaceae bacterium]
MTCLTSKLAASVGLIILSVLAPVALLGQNPAEDSREKIATDQARLAEQYELLEQKLFSLYQYEQDQNPERSELLQRAYQQSREKLTLDQITAVVRLLEQARLRDAESSQVAVSKHLEELLALLQSEDRSQRVRNEIDRYKEYLKEVNRILRIQQGIRGQAENGDQGSRLQDAQQQNADRTGNLDEDMEAGDQEAEGSEPSADPGSDSGDPSQPQPGEETQPGEDSQPGGQPPQDQSSQGQQPPPSDAQPSPGQSQPGQPPANQTQETPPNPVRQRLQQAEQKMREAREKLEQAEQDASVEDMREAERELAQAKQELEQILRQLREEEIERTLASLEARFRRMLEQQVKIYDDTVRIENGRGGGRDVELEMESAKLSSSEMDLVTQADRALLLLEDDGSSVAIAEAVRQIQQDMQQVADRLSAARTGPITQQLEEGIIETLGFLIEVFEQAQEDLQNSDQQQGQPQQGQPGEEGLINELAELKLIRGLQNQILGRHQRYAQLLDNPNDVIGHTNDPGIRTALERLGERQQKLQQITHDIVVGKNR